MKHFAVHELVDKETYNLLGMNAIKLFNQDLLKDIDQLRSDLGKTITINTWFYRGDLSQRGFRSQKSEVGDVTSQHRKGNAIDFDVEGMEAIDVRSYILGNSNKYPSITRMEAKVDWIHIDCHPDYKSKRIYLFDP